MIYYKLYKIFRNDIYVKIFILAIQCLVTISLLIYIRRKLNLENLFIGEENEVYSTLVIWFIVIIFGVFNNFYYSEKRVVSILKKYSKDNSK